MMKETEPGRCSWATRSGRSSGARRTSGTYFLRVIGPGRAKVWLCCLWTRSTRRSERRPTTLRARNTDAAAAASTAKEEEEEEEVPDDVLESGSESSDDESVESATTLSDDDLEAYDLEDDGADLVPVQPPKYLRDLLKLINEGTDQELARERLQMALATCPALVRSRPADLEGRGSRLGARDPRDGEPF